MGVENRIVQMDEVPKYTTSPFPAGSNSIYTAGIVQQNNQNNAQNALIGKTGGKRNKYYKGGNAPQVVVPSLPSYTPDKGSAMSTNVAITKLSIDSANNAKYDNTTSQSDVAKISAETNNTYYGKGGKTRKNRKNRYKCICPSSKCKSKKHKLSKRRKRNSSRKRMHKCKH